MNSGSTVQDGYLVNVMRAAVDYIEELKNSKINDLAFGRLKTLIQTLVANSNLRLLLDFPVEIIEIPIDDIRFEIGDTYLPELTFSKMKSFVVDVLDQAERLSDETQCLDALRILINYYNIVVFSRFNRGLELGKLGNINGDNL